MATTTKDKATMGACEILHDVAFDDEFIEVLISVLKGILRELHLPPTDPIAVIIARNVVRFAQAGERDPERLRELSTEFLRD